MSHIHINMGSVPGYYESFCYPAGETQVRIRPEYVERFKGSCVTITSRIGCAQTLVELLLLADAISAIEPDFAIDVVLPYMPYGRADRRFVEGDCHGLSTFLRILSSHPSIGRIATFDIHSEHPLVVNVKPTSAIRWAIESFSVNCNAPKITVLHPDAGACRRFAEHHMSFGCNTRSVSVEYVAASKVRDPRTGKLDGFDVPQVDPDMPMMIVDDICDGGGTFIGISKRLRDAGHRGVHGLYVSHGIFSRGIHPILESFGRVYTTNTLLRDRHSHIEEFDAVQEIHRELSK